MKTNNKKQVAAFDQVLGHCNDLGAMYNPSTESIKVTALTSALTSARESIKAVDTAMSNLSDAIDKRQSAFSALPGIGTRILNAFQNTSASPEQVARIRLYRDKFRMASRPDQTAQAKPEDSSKAQPSSARTPRGPLSQLDFESKITNLGFMIDHLKRESTYKPNETAITIEALENMLADMIEKHKAVIGARVALKTARLARDKAVFGDTGLYGSAKSVKRYILSLYGATSAEYRMFRSISVKSR